LKITKADIAIKDKKEIMIEKGKKTIKKCLN
jgi:hypothetical protein